MSQESSDSIRLILSVDKRLRITSWDTGLEEIFRKSSTEFRGIPYHQIIPRIYKGNKDAVVQVLKSGKPTVLKESHIMCFCGEAKAAIRVIPLKDRTGKITGADIIINAYPSCTTWKRLKESQKLLDIGKFAATFAHGVRNPLNAIKGAVVYIGEKYTHERKLMEFSKIIVEEISRLDNFIAKFLSTSISEEGLAETDINSMLKKIENLTSLQAQSRNIKTIFEYGYTFPIRTNSFHLEQAILNVINNALEAMHSGGRLKVKTKSEIHSGTEFASIEISDTGPGMAVKRSTDITISSEGKGKGLGLFITREILRSCGGHLEITSKKGMGTTVKLFVPTGKNG